MTSEFDAIDYARELEAAGVPHAQAIIHAKAMATAFNGVIRGELNALAQRLTALIAEVKEELIETEMRLQRQIGESEARMNERIEALRLEVDARFVSLENKIDARFHALDERIGALEVSLTG